MSREQLYLPKKSSVLFLLEYIDVVRQTKTNLDILEETIVDDVWNIDAKRHLSENWSGSVAFRILNESPLKCYSWEDGRWTKTQVTSKLETIWPEYGRLCPHVLKREQSSVAVMQCAAIMDGNCGSGAVLTTRTHSRTFTWSSLRISSCFGPWKKSLSCSSYQERIVEQSVNTPAPPIKEEIAEVLQVVASEAHPTQIAEQNVEIPVPPFMEDVFWRLRSRRKNAKVLQPSPQGHIRQRIDERSVDLHILLDQRRTGGGASTFCLRSTFRNFRNHLRRSGGIMVRGFLRGFHKGVRILNPVHSIFKTYQYKFQFYVTRLFFF